MKETIMTIYMAGNESALKTSFFQIAEKSDFAGQF